ncbi:iron ABC transporter permease [Faecalibacter macacae]|uniref:Iron ABC transporter permease n=1 Tax=Faecalibacter macacae TaxID=1859289 RepID=A0A3L9M5F8_9FLAO|nr:iron ABC transporter permease [Faecalibacter macacae]RLZ08011.1 iron ABC transporter permease [Faecalibacter macacae]
MKEKPLFYLICCLTIFLFFYSLTIGKVEIPIKEIIGSTDEVNRNLVLNFRLPKSITAVLIGLSLPIAGFLMQELFKNPLAEPSVLGVTSMASLGVAIVVFLFTTLGLDTWLNNPWLLIFASFIGSIFALFFILLFLNKVKSSASLVILGFMLSGLTVAFIGLMQYFSTSDKIKTFLMWGFGSISGLSWEQVGVFALFVSFGLIGSIFTLRGISALILGEKYAQSVGIDIRKLRILILVSAALLTASATAFTGPIAFVGLAVPHICRSVLKTGNMRLLFRWVLLAGVCIMLLFSILTDLFPFGTLPINIITSLIGAPIVISILLNNKYEIR